MRWKVVGCWFVGAALLGCEGDQSSGAGGSGGAAGAAGAAGASGTGGAAGATGNAGAGGSAAAPGSAGAAGSAGASMVGPVEAAFSGLCLVELMSPERSSCRGREETYDCARKKCDLDACAAQCTDYIQCIRAAADPCTASISCTHGEPCLTCQTNLQGCIWIDKCSGLFKCGAVTEGGPCTKLDACCKTQNNPTACSGFVQTFSQVGGDTSCQQLIDDRTGFRAAYTNDPPCTSI